MDGIFIVTIALKSPCPSELYIVIKYMYQKHFLSRSLSTIIQKLSLSFFFLLIFLLSSTTFLHRRNMQKNQQNVARIVSISPHTNITDIHGQSSLPFRLMPPGFAARPGLTLTQESYCCFVVKETMVRGLFIDWQWLAVLVGRHWAGWMSELVKRCKERVASGWCSDLSFSWCSFDLEISSDTWPVVA